MNPTYDYPNTNFQDLNLDYVLKQVNENKNVADQAMLMSEEAKTIAGKAQSDAQGSADIAESAANSANEAAAKAKEAKQVVKKELTIEPIQEQSNIKEIVDTDLKKYYIDKGIPIDDSYMPLETVFEWFYSLCQRSNYMIDLDKRRQIYDSLIVDYLHELKDVSSTDRNYFADIGEKISIVQKLRTPVDNEVDKYKIIEPVIELIQNNNELMTQLQEVRTKLLDIIKNQQDPKYVSNTPSLQEHDFVIKSVSNEGPIRRVSRPNLKNKYSIKVLNVLGLYGNPTPQTFYYNSGVFATSEDDAKKEFISYLRKDFPSLRYKTTDIVVEPWSESRKESL